MFNILFHLSLATTALASVARVIDGAYIVKLSPETGTESGLLPHGPSEHDLFHKRALHLDYTVRHEFKSPDLYLGLSVKLDGILTLEEGLSQLNAIPGVESVSPVYEVHLVEPDNTTRPVAHPFLSYPAPAPISLPSGSGNLASALQMGGVDKLHLLGIKGEGVKVGIIDTGIDYRHPALGAGFGKGYKVVGGYSWIQDNGTVSSSSDPLAICYGGAHGTHVAGIIGMNPLLPPLGLPLAGVAPDASLYMYRIFDCQTHSPGSDYIMAAMLKALEDGVDLVSMSLGIGQPPINGLGDPLAEVTKKLTDAGVGVIVAMANDASGSAYAHNLYSEEWPSTEPSAIGVGSIANTNFPVTYSATDSRGGRFQYASIWPVPLLKADMVMVEDGCSRDSWDAAVAAVSAAGSLSTAVFAFAVTDDCRPSDATGCCTVDATTPKYVMGLWANTTNIYNIPYTLPSQARMGKAHFLAVGISDAAQLAANLAMAGGSGKFKLNFPPISTYSSPTQNTGGMVDWYSSFGPERLTYKLKPQISAPGGNILSTWPLGDLGGYGVLSGTSMATPYIAGCYALIKSKFPAATPEEIKSMLQTTATPTAWIFDQSILAATQQQGAGLVNILKAITTQTTISPGQLLISDTSKTSYGVANLTITNTTPKPKTYTLSHRGAGYMDQYLDYREQSQTANYGAATFSPSTLIHLGPGQSTLVGVTVSPPPDVVPSKLPVFGGYITVHDLDSSEDFSIPYVGPPYSLYNTRYIIRANTPDLQLPHTVFTFPNGTEVEVRDILEVDDATTWSSSATYSQWTSGYRIDVLPANTTVTVVTRAADPEGWTYRAAGVGPGSSFCGYGSYGSVKRVVGLTSPANNYSPQGGPGMVVVGDDGGMVVLREGDYRWLVSVLRQGGDAGVVRDWDTWLGPVIRFV